VLNNKKCDDTKEKIFVRARMTQSCNLMTNVWRIKLLRKWIFVIVSDEIKTGD